MLNKPSKIIPLIIISIFCLIAGCVSVQGLYHAPSFTYQSIYNDNIGVGGVALVTRPLSTAAKTAYADYLQSALISKYPGLNIMPAGDAITALSPRVYRHMMRAFRISGTIRPEYLQLLQKHIHHMRYLVFARILSAHVDHDTDIEPDPVYKHQENTTYSTKLTLLVKLIVYDLTTKRIVWSGTITDSNSNTNNYASRAARRWKNWKRAATDIVFDAITYTHKTYPPPPATAPILRDIFRYFMPKFPQRVAK